MSDNYSVKPIQPVKRIKPIRKVKLKRRPLHRDIIKNDAFRDENSTFDIKC